MEIMKIRKWFTTIFNYISLTRKQLWPVTNVQIHAKIPHPLGILLPSLHWVMRAMKSTFAKSSGRSLKPEGSHHTHCSETQIGNRQKIKAKPCQMTQIKTDKEEGHTLSNNTEWNRQKAQTETDKEERKTSSNKTDWNRQKAQIETKKNAKPHQITHTETDWNRQRRQTPVK